MKPEILYSVKAQRGTKLRCKGWKQETILRMLENNMENAQQPEKLVIYGGMGKCARNWESYYAMQEALSSLENDETLAVQSGMPVAIFKTHRLAPRVVMAHTNIIQANWPDFYDLQDKNLTFFASYTAGPWEYIGSQGVVQGTFETLGAAAKRHFGGSLVGKVLLTAGLGGMGQTQPRAMTMHGGVCLTIEIDPETIQNRIEKGMCDVFAGSLEEGIEMADKAKQAGQPLGIAAQGNASEAFSRLLDMDWMPDIMTEMCPCHDPLSYVPAGFSPETAGRLRREDRNGYLEKSRSSMMHQLRAMNRFSEKGCVVFEYGTFIRKECRDAGMPEAEAMQIPGCIKAYVRDLFCFGRGPFRWTCVSGEKSDQERLDDLVLEMFPNDDVVQRWIPLARDTLPIEGLPARVCFLGYGQRKAFGMRVNELVRKGELAAPIAFSRDNLDSGSITNPVFETEQMNDGSDRISDWPYLNALLNAAGMADLVSIQANGAMGMSAHTGVTMIADGSDDAELRLEACLTTDSGIGVVRHAQAGYVDARQVAEGNGPLTNESINVPLWWQPEATFGPDDS